MTSQQRIRRHRIHDQWRRPRGVLSSRAPVRLPHPPVRDWPGIPREFFYGALGGRRRCKHFQCLPTCAENMRCFTVANGAFQSRTLFLDLESTRCEEANARQPTKQNADDRNVASIRPARSHKHPVSVSLEAPPLRVKKLKSKFSALVVLRAGIH